MVFARNFDLMSCVPGTGHSMWFHHMSVSLGIFKLSLYVVRASISNVMKTAAEYASWAQGKASTQYAACCLGAMPYGLWVTISTWTYHRWKFRSLDLHGKSLVDDEQSSLSPPSFRIDAKHTSCKALEKTEDAKNT
jgi:hypothetical protein